MSKALKVDPDVPAFPVDPNHNSREGISIRTWLAGIALQGLCACSDPAMNDVDDAAKTAVGYADALIAELNK